MSGHDAGRLEVESILERLIATSPVAVAIIVIVVILLRFFGSQLATERTTHEREIERLITSHERNTAAIVDANRTAADRITDATGDLTEEVKRLRDDMIRKAV